MTRRSLFKLAAGAAPVAAAATVAAVARPTVAKESAPASGERGRYYSGQFLDRHFHSFGVPAGSNAPYNCSWPCRPPSWKINDVPDMFWIPESDAPHICWTVCSLHNGRRYTLYMTRLPYPSECETFHGYAGHWNAPFDFLDCHWAAFGDDEVLSCLQYDALPPAAK